MENSSIICDDITDLCVDSATSTVFLSIDTFCLILHVINIFFLKMLEKSKRTAYFWIVVNISICDIMTCSTFFLAIFCELNKRLITLSVVGARTFQVTVTIFAFSSFVARNFVLAIGTYEWHISICHPLQVESNKIVNNMKLCVGAAWIISFVLLTIFILTDSAEYCFGEFGALIDKPNNQTKVAFAGSITTTFITSAICLSKVWRELQRMQSRNAVYTPDDLIVKRSAQYIRVVSIALYLSYIPTVMSAVFNSVDVISKSIRNMIRWIAYFYMTVSSISNVLLYFLMTPGYHIQVMKLLRLRTPTVEPQ
ncbi:hypothetical protein EB796_000199 [Bugula neritina]|uniref:G-protein coupled receptors family 1 profile domain-containing protein n=1 Tax=Bugula neritina TaxID=10212 RepID=A0A7J7KTG3_BUGNE|nr:hypothetical protein EB796_000199 [Bugula neritina]